MVTQVTGYLASDGQFFESEHLCESHEATIELNNTLRADRIDPELIRQFIMEHVDIVARFCKAMKVERSFIEERMPANNKETQDE